MFDFGDELIIESYRIPWLIWIQLLVMVLLIILLYCMGNFSFDLSHHAATPVFAASSSAGTPLISTTAVSASATGTANGSSSTVDSSKVGENQRGKEPGTSGSRVMAREDDMQERNRSSSKGATRATLSGHSHHPCHIFGLAKQAFLKCLGLGSTSESYSKGEHRKEH